MSPAGRREHYRRFYETDPPPGEQLMVVLGNCQAESVRLLLDPDDTRSVRVPPVFELDDADLLPLHRLLRRATALITQPVREDYRGLPLGTAQLASALPDHARSVRFPIVRYAGLHPFHVVVHSGPATTGDSGDGGDGGDGGARTPLAQPPVAAYHDLRTVARALGRHTSAARSDGVRAVAEASLVELRRRESLTEVAVSAVLEAPGPEHMRTVNHPGNPVLLALAAGVAGVLGLDPPRDPGRRLLNSVRAPLEPVAARAWGLAVDDRPATWRLAGRDVPDIAIVRCHLDWYAEHPHVARAVWQRHESTAALLGLL